MADDELLAQVRKLRQLGDSPKEIARTLGLRPAAIIPLIRQIAELDQAVENPADRALVGCWVNPGWSVNLGLDGAPAEWASADPGGEMGNDGFAVILIARQERASKVSVCGFLVDVYCLGVKNAVGPLSMGSGSVEAYRRKYFGAFDEPPVTIPIELAQHLVHGATAYARTLGFEPHSDFAEAAAYLGTPADPTPIQFGQNGKPYYISGPHDDPRAVLKTLEKSVGSGNYEFMTAL